MRTLSLLLGILATAAVCAPQPALAQGAETQRISGSQFVALAKHAVGTISLAGDSALV